MEIIKKLRIIYDDFFNELNINRTSGLIFGQPVKFATYPFIGSRYGETKKIVIVGLDIGSDEKISGIQSFEERRKAIEYKDIKEHNPHIAGTYVTGLFLLRGEADWGDIWQKIKSSGSCQEALRTHYAILPKRNPLSFLALTNYFKFVTPGRKDKSGGVNRKYIHRKAEDELFFSEIRILNPDIIVFQSTLFFKKHELIEALKFETRKIYIGPHPSYRGKKSPECFAGRIRPFKVLGESGTEMHHG